MKKYWLWYVYGVIVLTLYLVLNKYPDDKLHLIICDVGQGDASLLILGSTQIVIDAGKDDQALGCLDKHMPVWDKRIEFLIITHPDFDHYGGVKAILDRYTVVNLAQLPLLKYDPEFTHLQQAIQREKEMGMKLHYPLAGQKLLEISHVEMVYLWPSQEVAKKYSFEENVTEALLLDKYSNIKEKEVNQNDLSLTLKVTYKEIVLVLTGDLEAMGELALVDKNVITDATVLKVGHHGSKTSTTESFLRKVRPEIALISVGQKNSYHHPDNQVISRLENYVHSQLYRTDHEGSIHLITDGVLVWKHPSW